MSQLHQSAVLLPKARDVARWAGPALLGATILLLSSGARADEKRPLPNRLEAIGFTRAPRIDGDLGDWPEGRDSQVAVLDRAEQVLPAMRDRWRGPDDLRGRVRIGVDTEALYVAVQVGDDTAYHPGQPWWHGDAVELFLDLDPPGPEGRPDRYTPGCWQIFLMPRNPEVAWGVMFHGARRPADDGGLRGVELGHRERAGQGYDVEVRIPWSALGLEGAPGYPIGFAVALDDADGPPDPSSPRTYMSWNGRFDLYRIPA
ncbi:MAG: sugar-binding protein, partial [Planctomycetota bacterium]